MADISETGCKCRPQSIALGPILIGSIIIVPFSRHYYCTLSRHGITRSSSVLRMTIECVPIFPVSQYFNIPKSQYPNISSIPIFQYPNISSIPIFPVSQYSNIPIFQYPNISSIPIFQYSNIPISQYPNRPIWSSHASLLLAPWGAREKRYGRLLGKVLYRSGG